MVVIGVIRTLPRFTVSKRIAGIDVDVKVKIKNIFSSNEAIIVGCNTTFDVSVEENIIDEKSIQGQFMEQYCDGERELKEEIRQKLLELPPSNTRKREEKYSGNLEEYVIGTTIVINNKKRKAYFVAIARLNNYSAVITDERSFLDALPKMWSEIRSKGGMENLGCPILGSRFARLKLSKQRLLFELIRSFIIVTRSDGKLAEEITFYISHDDFKKGHFNMEKIKEFLEHECTEYYIPPKKNGDQQGTPI